MHHAKTGVKMLHSKENWSLQLGHLLVHSQFTSLAHYRGNALLCARFWTTWTLHVLGLLSAQEVYEFVCLKCKLSEDVHHLGTQVHKELKWCTTLRTKVHFTAIVQVL